MENFTNPNIKLVLSNFKMISLKINFALNGNHVLFFFCLNCIIIICILITEFHIAFVIFVNRKIKKCLLHK